MPMELPREAEAELVSVRPDHVLNRLGVETAPRRAAIADGRGRARRAGPFLGGRPGTRAGATGAYAPARPARTAPGAASDPARAGGEVRAGSGGKWETMRCREQVLSN